MAAEVWVPALMMYLPACSDCGVCLGAKASWRTKRCEPCKAKGRTARQAARKASWRKRNPDKVAEANRKRNLRWQSEQEQE